MFALLPSTLHAQASITGIVKDTSGAVLPGVTVEAASPALIVVNPCSMNLVDSTVTPGRTAPDVSRTMPATVA